MPLSGKYSKWAPRGWRQNCQLLERIIRVFPWISVIAAFAQITIWWFQRPINAIPTQRHTSCITISLQIALLATLGSDLMWRVLLELLFILIYPRASSYHPRACIFAHFAQCNFRKISTNRKLGLQPTCFKEESSGCVPTRVFTAALQMSSIFGDETGVEYTIHRSRKVKAPRPKKPRMALMREVFGHGPLYTWFLPCSRSRGLTTRPLVSGSYDV